MDKEKNSTASPIRELVNLGVYKRSQGRIARQVTFAALAAILAIGAWRLTDYWIGADPWQRYGIPAAILMIGLWICFRVVNVPRFADFLIAVEAEMNKVSWPTRSELIRASLVVLFLIVALAAILFTYDIFWRWLLDDVLGVIGGQ